MKKESNKGLVILIEAGIFAALAFVIALLPKGIGPIKAEIGMIPIVILSYRRGLKTGLVSGFLWGIIKIATGKFTMLSVLQVLVEYIFAYLVAGLSGVGASKLKQAIRSYKWKKAFQTIAWSTLFATTVKYFVHFIAGVVYWGIYAPEGMNAYLYSFIVNGGAGLASFIVVGLVVGFIVYKAPRIIFPEGLIKVKN
ncbi:MAG: energy-coupled thiamine transporter ThiT [Atopostipes sp.]|nr:energy-coupled thiamine transporter ThiT [Atopostipes sp.]